MMLARKWDRLENIIGPTYDIFAAIQHLQDVDGSAIAEIRDLRRYLLLVEAEMTERLYTKTSFGTQGDTITTSVIQGIPKNAQVHFTNGPDLDESRHGFQKFPERLEDGVLPDPVDLSQYLLYHGQWLVDRGNVASHLWEHLPRLPIELNHVEWRETPECYQPLYSFDNGKYRMSSFFQECWGRG